MVALLALIVSAAAAARSPGTTARIELMTLETRGTSTALTLALSRPVQPQLSHLHAPERLVIDLPDTRRAVALPAPQGLVSALRVGAPTPHLLRVVLELRSAARPRLVRLAAGAGARLRIELQSATAAGDAEGAAGHAHVTATLRAAHAPQGSHEVIVAVDAGHGGMDPGASGADGTHEKDVTLAIARALAARIDREPGMRAVLTRDGDYFITLHDRIERAGAAHADMFISIHADAVRDRAVSGASVYILSERGASSREARELAEQQNAVDLKGGIALTDPSQSLHSVLLDVVQSENIGESVEAADRVLHALDGVGAVRKHEVERAAFVVLKSPAIPSMLIETAYISNPREEQRLRSATEQLRLADAIFAGVAGYFRDYPPDGSLFARSTARAGTPSQGG
jgi:N-acetylmuramoyl-L-alanine amidase